MLDALRRRAPQAALLFDFDGTLSATVDDPDRAEPLPGVAERLDALAARYRTVAVISGRPVAFLLAHLPTTVSLSGQYGLERAEGGAVVEVAGAARWAASIDEAVVELRAAGPEGLRVEPKGLTATVHWRERPDHEAAARALAERVGERLGLARHEAKASVELRPPVSVDKGSELRRLVIGATAALYVGDDVGDLPAIAALHDLGGAGALDPAVAAAVDGPELPSAVRAAADLLVPGSPGVLALLDALLDGAPSGGLGTGP